MPVLISTPIRPMRMPRNVIAMARTRPTVEKLEAATIPNSSNAKYSWEPKPLASSASGCDSTARIMAPDMLPMNDAMAVTKSAIEPRPCWFRGKPSRQVTAVLAVPGRLSRMLAVEPP